MQIHDAEMLVVDTVDKGNISFCYELKLPFYLTILTGKDWYFAQFSTGIAGWLLQFYTCNSSNRQ